MESTSSVIRERILDVAQELIQVRTYQGFSYADIAERVQIRKPSIHYHFPSKADLGLAIVQRFRQVCRERFAQVDPDSSANRKLELYAGLYRDTLAQGRMCLCGMLSTGFATLPGPILEEVIAAFDDQERWLMEVISEGQAAGIIRPSLSPQTLARTLIEGLEGALLMARLYGDPDRFDSAWENLVSQFDATHAEILRQ